MPDPVTAYVALGSNLDDPRTQVERAFDALACLPRTTLHARSRLYRTPPWGFAEQPDFINAVAQLETGLSPRELLDALLSIERQAGRVRGPANGPRMLDLDLLLHGTAVLDEAGLMIPHPRLHQRAFVLLPLAELAPELDIPGHGRVSDLLSRVDTQGCTPLV